MRRLRAASREEVRIVSLNHQLVLTPVAAPQVERWEAAAPALDQMRAAFAEQVYLVPSASRLATN